jgi:hypothetical protein
MRVSCGRAGHVAPSQVSGRLFSSRAWSSGTISVMAPMLLSQAETQCSCAGFGDTSLADSGYPALPNQLGTRCVFTSCSPFLSMTATLGPLRRKPNLSRFLTCPWAFQTVLPLLRDKPAPV